MVLDIADLAHRVLWEVFLFGDLDSGARGRDATERVKAPQPVACRCPGRPDFGVGSPPGVASRMRPQATGKIFDYPFECCRFGVSFFNVEGGFPIRSGAYIIVLCS